MYEFKEKNFVEFVIFYFFPNNKRFTSISIIFMISYLELTLFLIFSAYKWMLLVKKYILK